MRENAPSSSDCDGMFMKRRRHCVFWFWCFFRPICECHVNANQMSEYKSDRILEYVRSSIRQNTAYRIVVSDKMPYTHKYRGCLYSSFAKFWRTLPGFSRDFASSMQCNSLYRFRCLSDGLNRHSSVQWVPGATRTATTSFGKAWGVSATAKMCLHLLANAAETHHLSNSKRCGDWPRKAVVQRSWSSRK